MKGTILLIIMCVSLVQAREKNTFIVAQNGSGDYIHIQEALDAIPENNAVTITIYIKPGIYKERLILGPTKKHVRLIGENAAETTITYNNYADKINPETNKNYGTTGSSSFFIEADDFIAENLTFENSSGPVGQAVAVNITGNKVAFRNCRFLGFQDTLYTKGPQDNKDRESLQYFENCYITGTVDFIFGAATALFVNCELHSKGKGGYITAASTPQFKKYGYVFIDCTLTGDSTSANVALGRPWRPYAKVVYINCLMGSHIKPAGWDNWRDQENELTVYYAEYNSHGDGANKAKRFSWTKQLSATEAAIYAKHLILEGWKPFE